MKDLLLTPFRFRKVDSKLLLTNEVGDFSFFKDGIIERIFSDTLYEQEQIQLSDLFIRFKNSQDWKLLAIANRIKNKIKPTQRKLSYLIIVPTLRCDLTCSYCQVSRAPLQSKGFDWDETHLSNFGVFLEKMDVDQIKIEFQGGEPSLRPDLIEKIIFLSEERFLKTQFVICTNLVSVSQELEAIYAKPNVSISTSIDGPEDLMLTNRTGNDHLSKKIFENFNYLTKKYGKDKVSALPTILPNSKTSPESIIDFYLELGFNSIFLRPVNYMGFARKTHKEISRNIENWLVFYRRALEYIAKINKQTFFEEYYFSLILKKIFNVHSDAFVDFRSPNFFMSDYCVIDFDGKIYPSDEARMLSRSNHMDLSIGELGMPIKKDKINSLNWQSMNQVESDCLHCAYMPFCGVDIIDNLSRYDRIDYPKLDSWFCRRHMMIFDFIFEKISIKDPEWLNLFLKWLYGLIDPPSTLEIFYDKAEIYV